MQSLLPTTSDGAAYFSHSSTVAASEPVTFATPTLTIWFNTIDAAAVLELYRIDAPGADIYAYLDLLGGQIRFDMNGPHGVDHILTTGSNLRDGKAHMVAATYDGATMSVYIDGALSGTLGAVFTPLTGTKDVGIGFEQNFTSGTAFTGTLDEAAIFDYVLTADQIATLYALGVST